MNAEELFLAHLGLIDRIVGYACRRNHYSQDEAEDLRSHVRLQLIDNDYAILRKFEGRSTFSTYLTTVIQRLSFQYRAQRWGKWRPSAEAQRLGDAGITLERLLTRDGYSLHEAIEMLTTRAQPVFTRAQLEAAYMRLPHRTPRPVLVQEPDAADSVPATDDSEARLLRKERECASRAAVAAIDRAIAALDAEDRVILQMRFWSASRVPEIASALNLDPKKVYKRIDRLLVGLRKSLETSGIDQKQVGDLLENGAFDTGVPENAKSRRSHSMETSA